MLTKQQQQAQQIQQAQQNGLKAFGDARRSWLGKLTKSKASEAAHIGEKVARGHYLSPMSQESVGERVEESLGPNMQQFGSVQGALHHIIQTGAYS